MAKEDNTFLVVGAYASVDDAQADYDVIKELLSRAERHEAKDLRDSEKAETEKQIGAVMSGQGS